MHIDKARIINAAQHNWRNARAIARWMESNTFDHAFDRADEEQREKLLKAVQGNDGEGFRKVIMAIVKSQDSVRDLRTRAMILGIEYYASMSKLELLSAIDKKEKHARANQNAVRGNS